MSEADRLREFIIMRLTLLVGATRMPRVSKKDIEQSIERAIKEIEGWKP
jgi:hypothetical protein